MASDNEFASLVRFFEGIGDGIEKARSDHASSERIIASAEYELGEVRKALEVAPVGAGADANAEAGRAARAKIPFRRREMVGGTGIEPVTPRV